ncbi:hypothetical protein AB0A74_12725 [Saccharothrix sp. NPDC042600]|uniref:hypothetical protein n=1 Tax=Saccharothrix TaxID=2071 RepID=UPI00340B41B0|nr:hypothetical protein GCM10017745_84130 [Saccharothrix mutabilis subsp. capreolus]
MAKVILVRLAPEWGTDPLWVVEDGNPVPVSCSTERLASDFGVPSDLAADIDAWDGQFQAVYDPDDPAGSGFPDEVTTAAWHARGWRLAGRLAAAVGMRVEFHTARGDQVFYG